MTLRRDSLFEPEFPEGFMYQPEFISNTDEVTLLDQIARLEFSDFEMHGVVAKRRVAFFGSTYEADVKPPPPLPAFLLPLRERVAGWATVPADAFTMALINEYRPGSPIGWHRDAPHYDFVAGISLLSACWLKFRPYVPPGSRGVNQRRAATHAIDLDRRSAYLMRGASRSAFEHHIPAVKAHRYSVTFRTVRCSREAP